MFGLMKIKQFAEEMNVPESTVYSWRSRGDIPVECFKKIGGTWYVRIKEMREWLEK